MIAAAAVVGARTAPSPPPPRLVWEVSDGDRILGAVVVDDLVAGRACGGLRIAPVVTRDELAELARVMTLKFAFFGIACGGAKAGLVVPDEATPEERRRRTRALGTALAPLVRFATYVPGTDLGCTERDLWVLLTGAGVLSEPAPPEILVDTSATARFSGRSAAIAALAALGRSARGATLAVLGYGRVGAACAARFVAGGGRLMALSTASGAVVHPDGLAPARLERLRARYGDDAPLCYPGARRVAPEELLGLGVDVVAPCGTMGMIATARPAARCRVVAPGANAAITPEAERGLAAAGVTVLPDFVANAGGVLVSHFWPLPLPPAAIDALLERHFRAIVDRLLARAAAEGRSPSDLARALAARSLARLTHAHREPPRHERLIARLGRGRLRTVLPPRLVTALVRHLAQDLRPPAD
jgi:glutamate dehydrogenase (NAD(P)+)